LWRNQDEDGCFRAHYLRQCAWVLGAKNEIRLEAGEACCAGNAGFVAECAVDSTFWWEEATVDSERSKRGKIEHQWAEGVLCGSRDDTGNSFKRTARVRLGCFAERAGLAACVFLQWTGTCACISVPGALGLWALAFLAGWIILVFWVYI
jgi:hypothetical protein